MKWNSDSPWSLPPLLFFLVPDRQHDQSGIPRLPHILWDFHFYLNVVLRVFIHHLGDWFRMAQFSLSTVCLTLVSVNVYYVCISNYDEATPWEIKCYRFLSHCQKSPNFFHMSLIRLSPSCIPSINYYGIFEVKMLDIIFSEDSLDFV